MMHNFFKKKKAGPEGSIENGNNNNNNNNNRYYGVGNRFPGNASSSSALGYQHSLNGNNRKGQFNGSSRGGKLIIF